MPESALNSALGSTLALVLWGRDVSGADDVVVYPGILVKRDDLHYLKRSDGDEVPLEDEWITRIEVVPGDIREVLSGCQYQLSLRVGDVREEGTASWKRTGLKWPS